MIGTPCTYQEFVQVSREYFSTLHTATKEEAEAKYNTLRLARIGLLGDNLEGHHAALTLRIATRKLVQKRESEEYLA